MEGQMSILEIFQNPVLETYNPIEDYARRGSGFRGGKERIRNFFSQNSNLQDRISFLKKEYGVGGFGSPGKKPFYIHSGDYNAKGHIIQYYNENLENIEMRISYSELAKVIQTMIEEDRYEINIKR